MKRRVTGAKAIITWAQRETQDYPDVHVGDLHKSWV